MKFNWRSLQAKHPVLLGLIVFFKRLRTKVAIALVAICIAKCIYLRQAPYDLDHHPGTWVFVGLASIALGVGLRMAAHGTIRKDEQLATTGVYSICRHPLYLGSIILTFGFCVLFRDRWNFLMAAVYFALFYSLAIIWEEIRLDDYYGDAHREYSRTVPLLLPIGRFRPDGFRLRRALQAGGALLLIMTVLSLVLVEILAETMARAASAVMN